LAGRGPVRRHGEFVVAAESLPDSHGELRGQPDLSGKTSRGMKAGPRIGFAATAGACPQSP
jgi:hypothetical protein